ncbi:hypothetical protein J6590_011166 [Homalodisca vitripennis]|nr:hypothetical protein J6590_084441 [Homalodisca vitripennis]KAG8278772.1 hypothetical protein J6590_011166 [Homalodisca vitripennis]
MLSKNIDHQQNYLIRIDVLATTQAARGALCVQRYGLRKSNHGNSRRSVLARFRAISRSGWLWQRYCETLLDVQRKFQRSNATQVLLPRLIQQQSLDEITNEEYFL